MRIFVFLLAFMLQANISTGSGRFRINSLFRDGISIRVNGKQYIIDSNFTSIPTAYPLFDILVFEIRDSNSIILCNFRKDSSYTIYHASCGNPDIIPSWKLDYDRVDSTSKFNILIDCKSVETIHETLCVRYLLYNQ